MSDQNTHQHVPGKDVDNKYPFPAPYFCFNPQVFDDENWYVFSFVNSF
jgi:hypothetical protein